MKHKTKLLVLMLSAVMAFALPFAGCSKQDSADTNTNTDSDADSGSGIDYMALVNKESMLPEGWEEALEITTITNSVGDEVKTESKAYEEYCALKEEVEKDLEGYEKGEVKLELDSAYRSVAEQQKIWDDFTEKYGEEYTRTHVAVPGYSEHQTGLALDLYFTIDGKDVYENEDLVQYPEIWEAIHKRLPEFGFILRFPEFGEAVTGYAYEPWHIRYLDDPEVAKEITDKQITFEEYMQGE
jgi:D-alanyl-D-alanine carboxypeptidase